MGHFAPDHFGPAQFAPDHFGGVVALTDPPPSGAGGGAGDGDGVGVDAWGGHFPLVLPSADVRGLLADAYLAHATRARLPLSISWLYGFDRAFSPAASSSEGSAGRAVAHDVEVEIVDADGAVVFDSTGAAFFTSRDWGSRFRVHEWRTDVAVCRIVQHATEGPDATPRHFPREIVPVDGRLDERCGHRMHDRVTSLAVSGLAPPLAGDGELVAGYNVAVAVDQATAGLRAVTRLTFSATPGAGLGLVPGCLDLDPVLRRLGGAAAGASGDLAISASGCYHARQPLALSGGGVAPAPATLVLGNDCGPCCKCGDFEDAQRGVLAVWDSLEQASSLRDEAQAGHAANIARWLAQKSCRESKPVKVAALPRHGSRVEVAASLCNHSGRCLVGVVLRVELSAEGADFAVDPGTVYATDPVAGSRPAALVPVAPSLGGSAAYEFYFDVVPTQANASARLVASYTPSGAGPPRFTAAAASKMGDPGGAERSASKTVEL